MNLTRDQRLNSKHEEIINRKGVILLILEGKFEVPLRCDKCDTLPHKHKAAFHFHGRQAAFISVVSS